MGNAVDVFLSYRRRDGDVVTPIAERLRGRGLSVFFDRWSLVPGEPFQPALERALRGCRTVVVFIGPSGSGGWHEKEMRAALDRQSSDSAFRVIPVLLPGAAKPEGFISANTWVDFGELDDQEAFEYLVSGIEGRAPGSVTTLETVEIAEQFPMIARATFLGIDFLEASHLAPIARRTGTLNTLYGMRVRLLDNLRLLGVPAETAQLLRRQLDAESFGNMHHTQLTIREDLATVRGTRVSEGFQAGYMLAGLAGLVDLYQAPGDALDDEQCALVVKYIDASVDHVTRASPDLFPGLPDEALHVWRPSVAAPFSAADAKALRDTVNKYIIRFTTPWGVIGVRDLIPDPTDGDE